MNSIQDLVGELAVNKQKINWDGVRLVFLL